MKHFNRRQFLWGSVGALTGLGAGCGGSGVSLPDSLSGYLLFDEKDGRDNSRAVLIRPDGSERLVLPIPTDGFVLKGASPDGRVVVGASYGTLALFSLADQTFQLASGCHGPAKYAWSPDGSQLACMLGADSQSLPPLVPEYVFRIYDTRTKSVRELGRATGRGFANLTWSGSESLLWADQQGTFHLPLDGSGQIKLAAKGYNSASPDGRYLLMNSTVGAVPSYARLDTVTGVTQTLLENVWPVGKVGWDREGGVLVLVETVLGYSVLRFTPDSAVQQLFTIVSNTGGATFGITWSPDGQSVAYLRGQGISNVLEVHGPIGDFSSPVTGLPLVWL